MLFSKPVLLILLMFFTFTAYAYETENLSTRKVEVCTIPLPVTSHIVINRMIFNTKHIYLKVDGKTFGTPFTTKGTYFGGDAYLYSDDILYLRTKGEGEECFPTHYFHQEEEFYAKKLQCIASKMTFPKDQIERTWYPIFDYHVLQNNCGSMANYIVECAGGKIIKKMNYSIGDVVDATKDAKIVYQDSAYPATIQSNYGEICRMALDECEAILSAAEE